VTENSNVLENQIRLLRAHMVELQEMIPTFKGSPASVSLIREQMMTLRHRIDKLLAEAAASEAVLDSATATAPIQLKPKSIS
jgi:hypothetical protein